jgi:hypothetical protein
LSIVVATLMVGRLRLAAFAEHRGAAGVGTLKDPVPAVEDQLANAASGQKLPPPPTASQEEDRHKTGSFTCPPRPDITGPLSADSRSRAGRGEESTLRRLRSAILPVFRRFSAWAKPTDPEFRGLAGPSAAFPARLAAGAHRR